MARFPYSKEFEPVVSRGDYLEILTPESEAYSGQIYKVDQVEAIQPFLLDWLQIPGIGTGVPPLGAGALSNLITPQTMRNYFETDTNILAQWRIDLIDDFLLQLANPGNAQFWQTPGISTFISKRLPEHTATAYLTTAPATDTLIWANSSSALLGARASGQTPTRKSRLIGLSIYAAAATDIYFGDAATAGGTAANAANKLFGVSFIGKDYIFLSEQQLPKKIQFNSGVVFQQTQAVATTVTAVVQESNTGIFDAELGNQDRAQANQNNEFFSISTRAPGAQVLSPLQVALSTCLSNIAGYQFQLEQVTAAPAGVKVIGIPLEQLHHSGTIGETD